MRNKRGYSSGALKYSCLCGAVRKMLILSPIWQMRGHDSFENAPVIWDAQMQQFVSNNKIPKPMISLHKV
jgi:hypothetical protein